MDLSISKVTRQVFKGQSWEKGERGDRFGATCSPTLGKISPSTPEEGKHCPVSSDEEESKNQWLPQKMQQCSEAVGLSMDDCKGGWDSLLAFPHEKEAENRATWAEESLKKKGSRKLHNLACSINYGKSKGSKANGSKPRAGQRRVKGHAKRCK